MKGNPYSIDLLREEIIDKNQFASISGPKFMDKHFLLSFMLFHGKSVVSLPATQTTGTRQLL